MGIKITNLLNLKSIPFLMLPFTIKYQPKKTNEIIGQDTSIRKLKEFVVNLKIFYFIF